MFEAPSFVIILSTKPLGYNITTLLRPVETPFSSSDSSVYIYQNTTFILTNFTPVFSLSITTFLLLLLPSQIIKMVFGRKKQTPMPVPPPQPIAQPTTAGAANSQRQVTRDNDRTIRKAQRELQMENQRLQQQEKQLQNQIKSLMRAGRQSEARMAAKNLVQVRNHLTRTSQASMQAGAIGSQARMAQTDAKLMGIMNNTTSVMQNVNAMNDPTKNMNAVQMYDMETERFKLNQELTDEVLESALGGADVDDEADDVLNSVLDEVGLEVAGKIGQAPVVQPKPQATAQQQPSVDQMLQNRFNQLGSGL